MTDAERIQHLEARVEKLATACTFLLTSFNEVIAFVVGEDVEGNPVDTLTVDDDKAAVIAASLEQPSGKAH